MNRSIRLCLATAILAAVACSETTSPEGEFNSARAKWTRVGPVSYVMTVHFSCSECGLDHRLTGPAVVEVRNGQIERKTYVTTGEAVAGVYYGGFPSMEELFTRIDMSIRRDEPHFVRYDPAMGYPREVQTAPGVGDWVYTVTDFQAK